MDHNFMNSFSFRYLPTMNRVKEPDWFIYLNVEKREETKNSILHYLSYDTLKWRI